MCLALRDIFLPINFFSLITVNPGVYAESETMYQKLGVKVSDYTPGFKVIM